VPFANLWRIREADQQNERIEHFLLPPPEVWIIFFSSIGLLWETFHSRFIALVAVSKSTLTVAEEVESLSRPPLRTICRLADGWSTDWGLEIMIRWPGASVEMNLIGGSSAPEASVATTR
jgi:hypothetical protein